MRKAIQIWPVTERKNTESLLYLKLTSGFVGQIVTLNSLMFYSAYFNHYLWDIISRAPLVLPDSWGICWAIKKLTGIKIQRYPGIDFIDFICQIANEKKWRIFLLGGGEKIAEQAGKNLQKKYPEITIAGTRHGYFSPKEIPEIVNQIRDSQSQILFVGLNIPDQEIFIGENIQQLSVNIAMGVGGSFDVISGKLPRAPGYLSKLGLEWLFRFYLQPWRITRIWKLPLFWQLIWYSKIKGEQILTLAETPDEPA